MEPDLLTGGAARVEMFRLSSPAKLDVLHVLSKLTSELSVTGQGQQQRQRENERFHTSTRVPASNALQSASSAHPCAKLGLPLRRVGMRYRRLAVGSCRR
jgi:hypothetical protein